MKKFKDKEGKLVHKIFEKDVSNSDIDFFGMLLKCLYSDTW